VLDGTEAGHIRHSDTRSCVEDGGQQNEGHDLLGRSVKVVDG
jgi:hypothetical protein